MKKITVILILAVAALSANAQIKVSQQGTSLTIPKGAVKLSETQNRDKVKSKFQINGDIGKLSDSANDYEVDGMQLSLFYNNKPFPANYLSTLKSDSENRRRRLGLNDDYYTSSINKAKGKEALIIRNHSSEWNYYSFYIINTNHNSSVQGILKYASGEETKAKQKIEELIESVQFQK